jgi:hypothetical protein
MSVAHSLKDWRGSKPDISQAFDNHRGVSSVQLNVVLADVTRFKTHSPRNREGDSFGFRFLLAFRNFDAIDLGSGAG